MVELVRRQMQARCEGNVAWPIMVDAFDVFGVGIQNDLQFPTDYVLVSLKNGYLLTEHRVFSYFQAQYWLELLYKASCEKQLSWEKSSNAFAHLSLEERKDYEQVLFSTLQQARMMPKDLLF